MDKPIDSTTLKQRHRARIGAALLILASVCAAAWGINRAVRPSVDADDIIVAEVRRGDIANTVNASGVAYLSHTTVEGRAAIRLAVGSWRTTQADVDRTWRALQEAAAQG